MEISRAVQELDSSYFLMRARGRKTLEKHGEKSIPALVRNFKEASPSGRAARLNLLHHLAPDPTLNPLAWEALTAESGLLRLEAVRFLAGHPDLESTAYLDWSLEILRNGTRPEKEAYIKGVRKPSPKAQTDLLMEDSVLLVQGLGIHALEAIRKGWRQKASDSLCNIITRIRAGRLRSDLMLPAMHHLGDVAVETAYPAILFGLTSPSQVLQADAYRAVQAAYRHLFRLRAFDDLLDLSERMALTFPLNMEYALDHADAMIQYGGGNGSEASRLLEDLKAGIASKNDTLSRIHCLEIDMGLAMIAFWRGGHWKTPLDGRSSRRLQEEPSNPAKRILAKNNLLQGALEIIGEGDGRLFYAAALEVAPYDPDQAEIDRLFTGRFSLSNLIWKLNRSGQTDRSGRVLACLVETLREDRSNYYPVPEKAGSSNDRIRSRIPLHEAYLLMQDCGDPEAGLQKIEPYILSIKDSSHTGNLEHLGIAYYYQGLALLDLDRIDAAKRSMEKGIKVYEQLAETFKEGWQDQASEDINTYLRREKSRGLLYLEAVNWFSGGGADESLRLVREARRTAPDFDAPVVAYAMAQARQGNHRPAALLLADMAPYPDRFYNMACLHALIGDPGKALRYLERHFDEYVPEKRRRIEQRYARRDPDLESIREDGRFKKLTE